MNDKLQKVIDHILKEIKRLSKDGEKFVLDPKAEEALVQLLEMQEAIEEAIKTAKEAIGEEGLKIDEGFKGVIGERVRCVYRKYGAKYKFNVSKKADLEPFLTVKEWANVDAKKVEEYLEEVGELPDGIYEAEREPKLSISMKDEDD